MQNLASCHSRYHITQFIFLKSTKQNNQQQQKKTSHTTKAASRSSIKLEDFCLDYSFWKTVSKPFSALIKTMLQVSAYAFPQQI